MQIRLAAAILVLASSPLAAQVDLRTAEQKAAPRTWNISIGAGIGAGPAFLGADSFGLNVRPVFSISRGLGNRWLSVADDNIGIGLLEGDNWRAGPAGRLLWERRESTDSALRGLGNVGFGAELGGFAEFYPLPWLRARGELRHGIGAHHALMGDVKLDAFSRLGERWIVSFGPRLSLAGRDFTQTYLGVNAGQSAASGLPQFRPGGGVVSYGATAQVTYQWNARLESSAFVQVSRLAGDAAKSPLVTRRGSPNQLTLGTAFRWTFDTGY